jgi:hypothetical protein
VPVTANDFGRISDILEFAGSQLVSPGISADEFARHLAPLLDEPERLAELRRYVPPAVYASERSVVPELKAPLSP